MRYGTNPHQRARIAPGSPDPLRVRNGEPSYVNYLDALNAWQLVRAARAVLGTPVAASFKHVSPAGVAAAGPLDAAACATWRLDASTGAVTSAYARARDADPKSSFGDVIAVSDPVDAELAEFLTRVVADGIVAPGFDPGTVHTLAAKRRGTFLVLEADPGFEPPEWEQREVFGVRLEQQRDRGPITAESLRVVEGDALAAAAVRDALLGMVALRYTQSNSVGLFAGGASLGIAAGQQNRVDCARLAGGKAAIHRLRRHPAVTGLPVVAGMSRQDRLNWQLRFASGDMTAGQQAEFDRLFGGPEPADPHWRADWIAGMAGTTLVSDGYLPFRDNVDEAGRYGVRQIVEPGGSVRSPEVAAACAELGITLVQTGIRLFHH
jgi:phosphoribosylaminoimidazolecarboxamide formyltransferase / IMP cyclohydrolase